LTGRRVIAIAIGLALVAGTAAAPADAAGKRVKLEVVTKGQRQLLARGLRVEVRSAKPGRVTLRATSTTFDDGEQKLAKKRFVRIGASRKARVKLRLTGTAAEDIRSCSGRALRVVAVRGGHKRGHASVDLKRNLPDCELPPIDTSRADSCDFIAAPDESHCLLPFPDDHYTQTAQGSPTGRRVNFKPDAMPANVDGVRIDPAPYNAADGFSQGSTIVLKVPGIDTVADVAANGLVPINHIGRYADADQRVVVIDARTGERWPIWAEIDSNATDPSKAALEIHPAKSFDSGGHYVVALRNLRRSNGSPIEAPAAFRYFRDEIPSSQAEINTRRPALEQDFRTLRAAGIRRDTLYLAWDFTVASDRNGYERALAMRDQAFAALGDTTMADGVVQGVAPEFSISTVEDFTPAQDSQIARRIIGTYQVPCFMTPDCGPGGVSNLDDGGVPRRNGTWTAPFECEIPRVGIDGPTPVQLRPYVFGHGLFGDATGVRGSVNPQLQNDYGFAGCATDEIGMSNKDLGTIAGVLGNLTNFPRIPDRLQQGLINELFLERLMLHPQGFSSNVAFHVDGATPASPAVLDTSHVYYMGASQGGIMGGALTAISPDATQSALLVGAMNYSILLPRSVDYAPYSPLLNDAYTDELERPLLFSLIQMLWDRGEPNGYAHVMTTDPPPNTPPHNLSLMVAVGDHQVTNYASEVEARTVGLKAHAPVIDPGRWPDYDVLWDVPRLAATDYPYHGSSFIYFDGGPMRPDPMNPGETIGTPPPPFENIPNSQGEDPHGAPRGADAAVAMTATMLQPNGFINEVCGGKPCYGGGWMGLP
jgi:hypothetical protein